MSRCACPVCHTAVGDENDYLRHLGPVRCPWCDASFECLTRLDEHEAKCPQTPPLNDYGRRTIDELVAEVIMRPIVRAAFAGVQPWTPTELDRMEKEDQLLVEAGRKFSVDEREAAQKRFWGMLEPKVRKRVLELIGSAGLKTTGKLPVQVQPKKEKVTGRL